MRMQRATPRAHSAVCDACVMPGSSDDSVSVRMEHTRRSSLRLYARSAVCAPSYLQVLQPPLQSLHSLSQLVYGLSGVPGQVSHSVLAVLFPSGSLTPGLTLRRLVGCRLAARQLGVELLYGPLLADDGLLLLQDCLSELDDGVSQLVLDGAATLNPVPELTVAATGFCARGDGVTDEAATCGILTSHRAPADQVQQSKYGNQHSDEIHKSHGLKESQKIKNKPLNCLVKPTYFMNSTLSGLPKNSIHSRTMDKTQGHKTSIKSCLHQPHEQSF